MMSAKIEVLSVFLFLSFLRKVAFPYLAPLRIPKMNVAVPIFELKISGGFPLIGVRESCILIPKQCLARGKQTILSVIGFRLTRSFPESSGGRSNTRTKLGVSQQCRGWGWWLGRQPIASTSWFCHFLLPINHASVVFPDSFAYSYIVKLFTS